MSESEATGPGPGSSAKPGCFILGAIITVFGGLIILYVVVCMIQTKAISGFTGGKPAEIQVFEPSQAQITGLKEKLKAVTTAAEAGRRERILFSRDDMNTLLATAEDLKDFRGTTFVEGITDRGLRVRMTRPMNRAPLSSMRRHLNAIFVMQPELRKRTVAFRVNNIISDTGTIPEQFIKVMDTMNLFQLDPENPNIKPWIPKLSRVYTESGSLVIETGTPADDQTPLDKP